MRKEIFKIEDIEENDYSSPDYSEYEMEDYKGEDDDDSEDIVDDDEDLADAESDDADDEAPISIEDEAETLLNSKIAIEDNEKMRARFKKILKKIKSKNPLDVEEAQTEALIQLKGLVINIANTYFKTYILADHTFIDDLMQAGYMNIIKYLPQYDPKVAGPSTYFYYQIKSGMSKLTNEMKHQTTSADAALKKKIQKADAAFEAIGRKPDIADYAAETGETYSKIRSVLSYMNTNTSGHLDGTNYDQYIPGNDENNSAFKSPEKQAIENDTHDKIIEMLYKKCPEQHVIIFIERFDNGLTIPEIAEKYSLKVDRVRCIIEEVRNSAKYDREFRESFAPKKTPKFESLSVELMPLEGSKELLGFLNDVDDADF